jgi:hypothetical protein
MRNFSAHELRMCWPSFRRRAAASDAFFNQYGRDPVISGAQQGGLVEITIPTNLWDEMLRTSSVSEREGYPGFSRRISTTEIRVNPPQAAAAINKCPTRISRKYTADLTGSNYGCGMLLNVSRESPIYSYRLSVGRRRGLSPPNLRNLGRVNKR